MPISPTWVINIFHIAMVSGLVVFLGDICDDKNDCAGLACEATLILYFCSHLCLTAEYFSVITVCSTTLPLNICQSDIMRSLSLSLSLLFVLISSVRCQDCWESNQQRHEVTRSCPLPTRHLIFDFSAFAASGQDCQLPG